MTAISSTISRVPNLLRSTTSQSQINRTNLDIFRLTEQLSSGRAINRASEDTIRAATIAELDRSLELQAQRDRNLAVADNSLATLDNALAEASDLLLEARGIGLTQLNIGSSAEERRGQAQILDSILLSMLGVANRESEVGYVFSGSTPGSEAVSSFRGGYRYNGDGPGLLTDLGAAGGIPVTLGAGSAIGATSTRVRGNNVIEPDLTANTRLSDMRGARDAGIMTGEIDLVIDGNPPIRVDLRSADTIGDVADVIEGTIRNFETVNQVTVLGPNGVGTDADGLTFDVLAGSSLSFADIGAMSTASDLGIADDAGLAFTDVTGQGLPLSPELTWRSPVGLLDGQPLGQIRLRAAGLTQVVDLSNATTFQDVRNAIESAGLGARVEINDNRDGIDVYYEVAGGEELALSIEEVPGNDATATRLGIRTMSEATRLTEFNDGDGVGVVSGRADAVTGLIDPGLNTDFRITLGNGFEIDIDLQPTDTTTVQTVLAAINAQANDQLTAAGFPPDLFEAGLTDGPNGIAFEQDAALGGPITIEQLNNSRAAQDLGLLDGVYDAGNAQFLAEDRATVRVDNVFTRLADLRDALLGNDTNGIAIATDKLQGDLDRLAQSQALAGGFA
ncbi:MAG: hypothetical protein AAF747_09030, partial [Planctomycetota bacterium]